MIDKNFKYYKFFKSKGQKIYLYHRIGMPSMKFSKLITWNFNGLPHRVNGFSASIVKRSYLYNKRLNINTTKLVI